ncbi:MAG: hypothetical protein K940chlam5_00844 [Candidatus Anoxychlamydiales bacterium]|nr:hypothetical protein [Candidatus Anoxychlamydiales bacterium]
MLVKFEISYTGKAHCQSRQVECISVELEGVVKKIEAYIDGRINEEQILKYRVQDEKGSRILDTISIASDQLPTIKLKARALGTFEAHNHLIMHDDGSISKEERFFYDKLPIDILELPKFEDGKRYRIRVINNDQKLKAIFSEVVNTRPQETTEDRVQAQFEAGAKGIGFDEETDLILAAKEGHIERLKELLQQEDIDVNAKNEFDRSALTYASREGHLKIVQILLQQKGIEISIEALIIALRAGHLEIAQELLQTDIDVNEKDNYGDTALSCASDDGHLKIVEILLQRDNIDFNVKNSFEATPLILASRSGYLEIVELLLKQEKIDITVKDSEGNTAQMIAKKYGNTEIVKLLEDYKKSNSYAANYSEKITRLSKGLDGAEKIKSELEELEKNSKNLDPQEMDLKLREYQDKLDKIEKKSKHTEDDPFISNEYLKGQTHSSTSHDISVALSNSSPEEKILSLIDTLIVEDEETENPLNYISHYEGKPEEAIKKLAKIYSVKKNHLMQALAKGYSSETIKIMLDQAIENDKNLDTEDIVYSYLSDLSNFDEDIILKFITHASEIRYYQLDSAFELKLSEKIISAIVDKVDKLDYYTWNNIIAESSWDAFLQKKKESLGDDFAITREISEEYWNLYKDKPKPYLPNLTSFSDLFILKIYERTKRPLKDLVGQVNEKTLKSLFEHLKERKKEISLEDFKSVLLYGYSDQMALLICNTFQKGQIDNQTLQIAKMRNYSRIVIQSIEQKLEPSSSCTIM